MVEDEVLSGILGEREERPQVGDAPEACGNLEDRPKEKIAGKFESVEALEKAYASLQVEFTKRCMELAKMRDEKAEVKDGAAVGEPCTVVEVKKEVEKPVVSEARRRDEAVRQYLFGRGSVSVPVNPVPPMMPPGKAVVGGGPRRVASVDEAGRMFERMMWGD